MTRTSTILFLLLTMARAALGEPGALKGTVTEEGRGTPVAGAVVLVNGPSQPAAPDAPHAVVDQRDQQFVPHVLAVAVGTTVDFPNHDAMLHDVYSASPAKKFDLGMYDRGETRTVTFDTPGVVRIGCNVHPAMDAIVVVHPNPWVAVTDAHGAYTIAHVPAGTYDVRIWHERLAERTLPVTITAGGVQALDVKLGKGH